MEKGRNGRAAVTAVISFLVSIICIHLKHEEWVVPIVLGVTFTGILNLNGDLSQRMQGMGWSVLWLTIATLLAGVLSSQYWFEIAAVALVGLAGGYAGILGPRSALIGVLSMVLFTVFAGTTVSSHTALVNASLLAGGSLLHLLCVIVPVLVRCPKFFFSKGGANKVSLLQQDTDQSQLLFRHAIRLAFALTVGTIIANEFGWPHPYWIPMTIVWMSKPDSKATVVRIIERIVGTLLGLGASVVLVEVISDSAAAIPIYTGIGVYLLLAYLNTVYSVAVVGITIVVICLFALLGEPVLSTSDYRSAATIVAGIITFVTSFLLRIMPGDRQQVS